MQTDDNPLAQASLDEVLKFVWSELAAAVQSAGHPFHTGEIATVGADGPSLRTVVLRRVDESDSLMVFHTDRRSPKVTEISADNRVSWHFYALDMKVQIRLRATAKVHLDDALADTQWQASAPSSRICYRSSLAPGAPSTGDGVALVDGDGRDNFAAVSCRVEQVEWLFLRHQGHRRARFDRKNGRWPGAWIAP